MGIQTSKKVGDGSGIRKEGGGEERRRDSRTIGNQLQVYNDPIATFENADYDLCGTVFMDISSMPDSRSQTLERQR